MSRGPRDGSGWKVRALQPFFLPPLVALALNVNARKYVLYGGLLLTTVGLAFAVVALVECLRIGSRSDVPLMMLGLFAASTFNGVNMIVMLRRERRRGSAR